ncbi:JAB1/Mov34/MPN/PAD-1 ubiquitin protease-domain-containing protein [Scenedesmus sp. NREL 46B-D3]|nr:JAB1/Mov34/MPN/PAD-1 ubiquitin protease-domain-containing protein [Scenedesmus sp. NREL 46B-D3]
MSLSRVVITPEVFLTCTTHALSTEAEEVMGLLLGDIRGDAGSLVAYIRRAVPQIRTDRRKDRVETSPEQMASCSALADHVSSSTGLPTRVVGWYHSHPHITVLPSHVDVNTQAMYQMLDAGFIGLIFSVFNSAPSKEQTIQVTAFQSLPGAAAAAGVLQGVSSDDLAGLDLQTQEALRASAAEHLQESSGASWHRKEVPLAVLQDGNNPSTLSDYVEVQRMLLAEEQAAHLQHKASSDSSQNSRASSTHEALLQLHDSAMHQQALLQHAECVLAPAVAAMRALSVQADVQEQQLREDNKRLQELLDAQLTAAVEPAADSSADSAGEDDQPSAPLIDLAGETSVEVPAGLLADNNSPAS